MSALSFEEQGYDRAPVADLAATFDGLNAAYEARFGFRYCVFVAGRSRAALLPDFETALAADRDEELTAPSTRSSTSPATGMRDCRRGPGEGGTVIELERRSAMARRPSGWFASAAGRRRTTFGT